MVFLSLLDANTFTTTLKPPPRMAALPLASSISNLLLNTTTRDLLRTTSRQLRTTPPHLLLSSTTRDLPLNRPSPPHRPRESTRPPNGDPRSTSTPRRPRAADPTSGLPSLPLPRLAATTARGRRVARPPRRARPTSPPRREGKKRFPSSRALFRRRRRKRPGASPRLLVSRKPHVQRFGVESKPRVSRTTRSHPMTRRRRSLPSRPQRRRRRSYVVTTTERRRPSTPTSLEVRLRLPHPPVSERPTSSLRPCSRPRSNRSTRVRRRFTGSTRRPTVRSRHPLLRSSLSTPSRPPARHRNTTPFPFSPPTLPNPNSHSLLLRRVVRPPTEPQLLPPRRDTPSKDRT